MTRSRRRRSTSTSPSSRRVRVDGFFSRMWFAEGLAAHDLAGAGDLEALGRAAVGLHLGHRRVLLFTCVGVGWRSVGLRPPRLSLGVGRASRRRARRLGRLGARPSPVSAVGGSVSASAPPSASASFGSAASACAAWAFLSGASTMIMLRPSSLGTTSTRADVDRPASATGRGSCLPELGVLHLPAPEHDRDLDLVALAEELLDLAGLGVEVAGADLGPVLHLLDRDVGALAAGLLGLLRRLVLVLAVVHDPADRRVGLVGHLDEVEVQLTGDGECLGQRLDADLRAVGSDQADLTGSDAIVDPGLVVARRRSYGRSLLMRCAGPPVDGVVGHVRAGRKTTTSGRRKADVRRRTGDGLGDASTRRTRRRTALGGRVGAEGPASGVQLCAVGYQSGPIPDHT